jgi:hypothetical protein
LPKLGLVRFAKNREVEGRLLNATIRRNPFVSLLVETEVEELPKTNSSVGVDVGLKDFAILFTRKTFGNPKFFRILEKKLADTQCILSRQQQVAIKRKCKLEEAKNCQKQKRKVALIHGRLVSLAIPFFKQTVRVLRRGSSRIIAEMTVNISLFGGRQNQKAGKTRTSYGFSCFFAFLYVVTVVREVGV